MEYSELSQLVWLLLASVILLLALLNHYQKKNQNKQAALRQLDQKLPPGPRQLPIIGNLHQLGSGPQLSFRRLAMKHGPIMYLKLGSIPTVVISSAEVVRQIVKNHDITFSSRPAQYANKKLSYGLLDIAFAPYGDHWRKVRKVSMVELLSVKRVESYCAIREEEVTSLVETIKTSSFLEDPINLSEATLALSNNIICRIMFGDKYGDGNRSPSRLYEILRVTQELLGGFCVADFFPQLKWTSKLIGLEAKLEKNFKELDDVYDKVIEGHLRTPSQECVDMVHVLLQLHNDPNYKAIFSNMNHIKGLLTDMFIAATDTTSATLVWTMTELIKNPEVMAKVQDELHRVIGNNKSKVEEYQLHELNYMKLAIKESLRMHPPAPLLGPRETIEKCTINGYEIPEKARVFINAQAIGMDPQNWQNPEKFWPERYVDRDVDFRGQDFILIPFGVGRRMCPGVNFAMPIVELVLANLLHCFSWKLPFGLRTEDINMEECFGLTMHKKVPLCLAATPREL